MYDYLPFFPFAEGLSYPDASNLGIVGAASIITGVMPIHHRNRPSDDPWAAYVLANPGPDVAPF